MKIFLSNKLKIVKYIKNFFLKLNIKYKLVNFRYNFFNIQIIINIKYNR